MVRLFFVMIAGFVVGTVALIVGLVVGGLVTYEMTRPFFGPDKINYQTLNFTSSPAKIYLTARVWGITGGSEEVRICDEPIDLSAPGNCLRFHTSELFYGRDKEGKSVMHVYSDAVEKDETARLGKVEVSVHAIDYKKLDSMRRDYDERGLMRISAP
ncbi:MAG TPA: hypothetical protein VJV05_15970 [Pyrinomonadaceae bacterium]|nr:hypothetical protein [Pyrinomonadaceae bacterium]